ncbi:MAG TPA: hypothetical protein VL691_13645, partial [Vicinamibacteria bacterium]|nr:hypothetical protein [Vicinamibacteria bacterium]
RIYVFASGQRYDAFQKSGGAEIGVAITRPGYGPNGETVVFDSEDAINLYNFKHGLPGEAFPSPKAAAPETPLQLKVGSASITPIGFMDFTAVWRNHTGGSGIGTNFASIPYGNNIYQTSLSEFRLSMQNSRIGFRIDADVKKAHVIGYMEADFLGNNPGNVAVSSNSNTLRSRVYWVDVKGGSVELLAGQTWSLITPGRTGISPLPGNLFYTQVIDVNYQAGLYWGRIPELRLVFHPSPKAAFAVALDSPEQYIGGSAGGPVVTLPKALATTYAAQFNNGTTTLGVPNRAPDVIAKLALDPSSKFHFEVGGVLRSFQAYNPTTTTNFTKEGGGGFGTLYFELFKGLRVMGTGFLSSGGGRYIFGQAPDLIAQPDGSLSLVKSNSMIAGLEYTNKNTLVYGYYSGVWVDQNATLDADGKTPIGYGYVGSPNGQNHKIQEITFGFSQTFWKDGKYGALALMGQYSHLERDPWYVAAGAPANAKMDMLFFNLRYTLPGSAPAVK